MVSRCTRKRSTDGPTGSGSDRAAARIIGTLPDAPVYKVVIAGSQLAVGTEIGVFGINRSPIAAPVAAAAIAPQTDRWFQLGKGLPKVTVWDLSVTAAGELVAGTHGRGTWRVKLPAR